MVIYGYLAWEFCSIKLEIQVLRSAAGYYIGTQDDEGPCSRESVEYWSTKEAADDALLNGTWTQKQEP